MIDAPFSFDYFLRLYERLLPSDYLFPLRTTGPGYELLQAFARIGERTSLAAYRLDQGLYAITAPSASFSTVEVEFARALSASSLSFTQKQGTLVQTTFGGRKFKTLADVSFLSTDAGPKTVQVQALFPSYQWNVLGRQETEDGEELAGEISKVVFPIQQPAFAEPFITVRQLDFASGGSPGMLEQIGLDRGIERAIGEDETSYRFRISTLPDTISPAAMRRNIDLIWLPLFLSYQFIETWNVTYQSCYDAPESPIVDSDFDPATFVYDDPRSTTPFKNRWLDDVEFRGAFIVVLPRLTSFSQRAVAMDDEGVVNFDFLTQYGQRACPAFDLEGELSDVGLLLGFFDGYDAPARAYYTATFNTLQAIKPAGVAAIIELQGN